MARLIKVRLIAQNKDTSIIEKIGKRATKYQVKTNTLSNITTEQVKDGFVTYAYINEAFLTKRW